VTKDDEEQHLFYEHEHRISMVEADLVWIKYALMLIAGLLLNMNIHSNFSNIP